MTDTNKMEPSKAVASIYITASGDREFDDWKCDLPVGRNDLVPASALAAEQAKVRELVEVLRYVRGVLNHHDLALKCGPVNAAIAKYGEQK